MKANIYWELNCIVLGKNGFPSVEDDLEMFLNKNNTKHSTCHICYKYPLISVFHSWCLYIQIPKPISKFRSKLLGKISIKSIGSSITIYPDFFSKFPLPPGSGTTPHFQFDSLLPTSGELLASIPHCVILSTQEDLLVLPS